LWPGFYDSGYIKDICKIFWLNNTIFNNKTPRGIKKMRSNILPAQSQTQPGTWNNISYQRSLLFAKILKIKKNILILGTFRGRINTKNL
jgi:hypothetical protein